MSYESPEILSSKTNEELGNELIALEREERELDLIIKRSTVAKIRAEQTALRDKVRVQQLATAQFLAQRAIRQRYCNHRKGGTGAAAVLQGTGQSAMYCVIKHKLPVGKYWILCQRCGKEWYPELTPLQNGGVATKATKGYFEALQYPTNNSESGSSRFDFQLVSDTFGGGQEEEE